MKFKLKNRYLVNDVTSIGHIVGNADVMEIHILEISPKGRIKVHYDQGLTRWEDPSKFEILEDLGKIKK